MKKVLGLIVISLLLNGCVGVESNLKKGNITIGMSKYQFCYVDTTLSGPCGGTFMDGFNNIAGGMYYPETKKEVMWARKKAKTFFVFKDVSQPFNYDTFDVGDGKLEKMFKSKEEALEYASGKEGSLIDNNKILAAKTYCESKGFTPGTEEFADCSLKKIKELSQ